MASQKTNKQRTPRVQTFKIALSLVEISCNSTKSKAEVILVCACGSSQAQEGDEPVNWDAISAESTQSTCIFLLRHLKGRTG